MVTHHARLNLIMFATIAVLVVFLYFRPQSQDIPEYPVSSSPAETAQSLRIVRQQKEIALKRLNNRWHMIKPVQVRADEKKITEILQILTAGSNQRFPLADLARFGLNQPTAQLYIDDEYFGFGGFAPTIHQQYVATGGYVYLISPRYALPLPLSASDLISPGLLASDEIPVKFELSHLTAGFQNGNWSVLAQDAEKALGKETIKYWIHLWQTADAKELSLDQEFSTDFVEAGLIKISLQDGQVLNLSALQNESEIILLRINEGIGYHFPVDIGRQLLDPHSVQSNRILPDN